MDEDDDIDEPWREPDPIVITPPKFNVIIGSRVMACNIHALNRAQQTDICKEAGEFYEEATVIHIEDEYICDVQFANGEILRAAKVNAFKN